MTDLATSTAGSPRSEACDITPLIVPQREALLAENRRLSEQLKHLVKTETALYAFQEQLDNQVRIYRQLNEIGRKFGATLDADEVLRLAVNFILYELNFERCVALLRSADGVFRTRTFDGYYDDALAERINALGFDTRTAALEPLWAGSEFILRLPGIDDGDLADLGRQIQMDEYVVFRVGGDPRTPPLGLLAVGNTAGNWAYQTRIVRDSEQMVGLANLGAQVSTALNNASFYKALEDGRRLLEQKVTERTRALSEANDSLKNLDKLKTDFFANVSHELRTPLTLSIGPLEVLLKDPAIGGDAKRHLKTIHANQLRLLKLMNELLDFARLEAGKTVATFRREDVSALLRYYLGTLEAAADGRRLELALDLPDSPLDLWLDRDKFEKIVMNLLSNAFKFTPDGGRIGIAAVADDDWVSISVSDTGIGIPRAAQAKVFERFSQADASETRAYSGTGIGLAMVKEYADLHGGSVRLDSEPGVGSTFRLRFHRGRAHLPAGQVVDTDAGPLEPMRACQLVEFEPAGPAEAPADLAIAAPEALGRATVLVVDDTADMRTYIASLLDGHYRVITARDGLEGLELARRVLPDLILSDVMMPRLSGNELCAAIKADPGPLGRVPVVLVTAKAEMAMKLEGLRRGADDYLVKPFNAEELLSRVSNLVRLGQQDRELRRARDQAETALADLKAAQEQLVQSEKMASLGALVAGVAHEINTPVGSSLTAASYLEQRTQDMDTLVAAGALRRSDLQSFLSSVGEAAKLIHINLQRAGELVQTFKQIAIDQASSERRVFNLGEYLHEVLLSLKPQIRKTPHAIDIACPPDITFDSYPGPLAQIITNLIMNALIHAFEPERGGTIRIAAAPAGPGRVTIIVSDDGRGMDEAIRHRAFDPFFTTRRGKGGSGLGLHIVYNLVTQALGGSIDLTSAPGCGATFQITLPLEGPT